MTRNDNRTSAPNSRQDHVSPTLAETSFRHRGAEMPPPPASAVLALGAVLSLILLASVPAGAGMKPVLHLSLPVEAETRAGAGAEAHSILSVCVLSAEAAQVTPTCAAQPISAPSPGDVPETE
jgi:hypothetical protein